MVTDRVELAEPEPVIVTWVGLKPAPDCGGSPLIPKETFPVNPPEGVMVTT